jgi:hypothetical protein
VTRNFEAKPAKRERTPIIMGIVSPSGAGKTKSALRLADGFARHVPGPIVMIDTEAGRAKHHSDVHKFLHIDMAPPFGPADHIAAWQAALRHNPSTIIQDSMSHEWEGSGGILEMQEAELDRMAGNDWKKRERCTMAAWIRPKAEHNKMKQFMLQQRVNWIFCFRSKPKIKPVRGGEPIDLGWQALGAPDLIYEMLLKVLLFPGAEGKPTWKSEKMGEQELMKLPGWFSELFSKPRQLDEDIGEQLARWAQGSDIVTPTASQPSRATAPTGLAERFEACIAHRDFVALEAEMRADWKKIPLAQRDRVRSSFDAAKLRCRTDVTAPAATDATEPTEEEMRAHAAKEDAEAGRR